MVKTNNLLKRREVVKKIIDNRGEAKVITGLGSASYDVFDAGDSDSNFYLWGAMGGAAMTGLGLALAKPDTPTIVITGDGETGAALVEHPDTRVIAFTGSVETGKKIALMAANN